MTRDSFDLSTFTYSGQYWEGICSIPWLGHATECVVEGTSELIGDAERAALEFARNLPPDTRLKLQAFIFNAYQNEIYGSMAGGDRVAPPISTAPEIWKLISKPGIAVSEEPGADHYFCVLLECVWDPEHGLSILFDDKGVPIDLGGQGDHF